MPVSRTPLASDMHHRHLNHQRFTAAAIDDVISRGRWADWCALREAALGDAAVMERIRRVCRHRAADPLRQRHRFWAHYAAVH